MIVIIDTPPKKAIWQNAAPSQIKTLLKVEIEGDFLNVTKNIYNQSVANIKLHSEEIDNFLFSLETRQWCFHTTPIQHPIGSLS